MWLNILLVLILAICVYTDLKSRKIYNKVILPGLIVAFFFHFMFHSFQAAILGFFVGLFILFIPYLLGGMGAGDVKLLALIGAIKGSAFVFATAIYMALIGAIIALLILLFKKGRGKALFHFLAARRIGIKAPLLLEKKNVYPYGPAIAGGALLCLLTQGQAQIW